jgi:hypothetical protein
MSFRFPRSLFLQLWGSGGIPQPPAAISDFSLFTARLFVSIKKHFRAPKGLFHIGSRIGHVTAAVKAISGVDADASAEPVRAASQCRVLQPGVTALANNAAGARSVWDTHGYE